MSSPLIFRPEPQTSSIPPSQRGHLEVEPDAKHPGRWRLQVIPDGKPGTRPGALLLTDADVRRLIEVLRHLVGYTPTPGGPHS